MPSISIHPPAPSNAIITDTNDNISSSQNPLPPTLHTPSGLAIIEIQGSIVIDDNEGSSSETNDILDLGRLVFPGQDTDTWDGKRVSLFVGKHQRLTGEVKKLAKPLAVIRRRVSSEDATDGDGKGEEQLEIAEIITQRILFASRPEPMGAEGDGIAEG